MYAGEAYAQDRRRRSRSQATLKVASDALSVAGREPYRDDLGYRIWRSRVRGTRWRRLAGRGCKPRDSMRPWTLVLVVLRLNVVSYNTVIEGARQTDVDVTCSSVIHACVT